MGDRLRAGDCVKDSGLAWAAEKDAECVSGEYLWDSDNQEGRREELPEQRLCFRDASLEQHGAHRSRCPSRASWLCGLGDRWAPAGWAVLIQSSWMGSLVGCLGAWSVAQVGNQRPITKWLTVQKPQKAVGLEEISLILFGFSRHLQWVSV